LLEGSGHSAEPFDLGDLEQIPAWLKSVAARGGAFAGLVHSAGIHGGAPLRTIAAAQLETVMRINVSAAILLAKGYRQVGCFQKPGSIVFLSSIAGLAGDAGIAAYSASKAALFGAARSLAIELARQEIRVNCVAAGAVNTGMTEVAFRGLTPEQVASIEALHPLGFGTAQDVAHAVAFLLSGMARWITGSVLVVDGGYTAH
jgi:NAD(P)-dependent dehydrogenase (short-subunit alcohol dehydrogenase family)